MSNLLSLVPTSDHTLPQVCKAKLSFHIQVVARLLIQHLKYGLRKREDELRLD